MQINPWLLAAGAVGLYIATSKRTPASLRPLPDTEEGANILGETVHELGLMAPQRMAERRSSEQMVTQDARATELALARKGYALTATQRSQMLFLLRGRLA